jgi:hypothetical protein
VVLNLTILSAAPPPLPPQQHLSQPQLSSPPALRKESRKEKKEREKLEKRVKKVLWPDLSRGLSLCAASISPLRVHATTSLPMHPVLIE